MESDFIDLKISLLDLSGHLPEPGKEVSIVLVGGENFGLLKRKRVKTAPHESIIGLIANIISQMSNNVPVIMDNRRAWEAFKIIGWNPYKREVYIELTDGEAFGLKLVEAVE
jgi:hypothetical protein